jgi:hypothetical protein
MGPNPNPGKEVALGVLLEVIGWDIFYAPFVYVDGGYVSGLDQIAQPLRGVFIDLVVVGGHIGPSPSHPDR